MREHGVEDDRAGAPDGLEGPGESSQVGVATDALETDNRDQPRRELGDELVGHDAEHHRIEALPVEVVEKAEQMPLDPAERVPLDEVDDPDRMLDGCLG
jgi:hypothetical protein